MVKMLKRAVVFFLTIAVLGVTAKSIGNQIPDFLKTDFFNIYRHAAIETRNIQHRPVEPSNVTYYLFTIDNPNEYITLDPKNLTVLEDRKEKIVFFIHGWTNSREIDWYEDLKNAFLNNYKGEYAVVQVDWKEPANQLYYVSSINTYDVAKFVAQVVVDLHQKHNVSLEDILLIGHSLGGQITGFVGKHVYKMLNRKLHRIIALDPAGPLFDTRPDDKRLNKNDAEIVEVIHSDGGTFGYKDPCGTVDFFPNGGESQPGCKRIDLLDITSVTEPITCDHHRAYEYFVEAVLNPGELLAKKCDEWDLFKSDKCENVEVALGDLRARAVGKFFLETNRDKPFSKKGNDDDGARGILGGAAKVLNVLKPFG